MPPVPGRVGRVGIACALGALIAVSAGTADAAVGDLTFRQCFDDNDAGAIAACTDVNALAAPGRAAVSPDGRNLYVPSGQDHAVVNFRRNPATGALQFQECFDDNDSGTEAACTGVDGLRNARQVAVSSDGRSVLVASNGDSAIANFDRNTATGALGFHECFDDDDVGPEAACDGADGLNSAFGI